MTNISERLQAAVAVMVGKGYRAPSAEIGCKALGSYEPVIWAAVHVESSKNWVDRWDLGSIEQALDAIDAAAASVPAKAELDKAKADAFGKLTPAERELIGVGRHGT